MNAKGIPVAVINPDAPAESLESKQPELDNGVGIAPEFREQVFLMFRRLHARTTFSGTGIGLSLVQRLVESLGGRVWIDPDHGPHGTCFVFTLPAAEAHEKAMHR